MDEVQPHLAEGLRYTAVALFNPLLMLASIPGEQAVVNS